MVELTQEKILQWILHIYLMQDIANVFYQNWRLKLILRGTR